MQYRGTLVCAPPGAGKTELILRWAVAAIGQGQSVLVVDVKGGLKDEIVRRLEHAGARLPAATFFFSTNPEPGTFSDRINFLAGLDATTPVGRVELEQVARAILPSDGFDQGEELRLYQNRLAYLTAMLGLVSLRRDYEPHPDGRDYDLSDVHAMAAREQTLYDWITRVAGLEARRRAAGHEPHEPGLRHWFDELAILLRGEWRVGAGEDAGVLAGQRADRDPYRYFTQGIVNALEPFAARGVLGRKVSGAPLRRGDGVFFRLDQLLEPAQVVMILEARELDVGSAEAVVSLAVTHLQLLLNRRHGQAGARPILLLLDETARLRGFDPKKYVALCRSAQAGVVLVYQQLEQIARRPGEERTVSELLENVGTQIYLGSLAGRNYELFSAQRGTRWQSSFTRTAGARSSHREQQITQVERSDVPLFARIPAGRFPALVYIRDHPCHKPFLVDLDRDDTAAPRDAAPDPADPGRLSLPPTARRLLADAARRGGQPGG
jgi:hypothetical protein